MNQVLPNDFKRQWDDIGSKILKVVEEAGRNGFYVLGQEVEFFESLLARYTGLSHAVGTANGLDAIEIGLRVLGIRPGDLVLTTPLSAFATTLAVLRCGGEPVFCDVDAAGLIDLEKAERALRDLPIRFMIPVHLYGHAVDLDALTRLKDDYGLRVVEDAAQALGARWQGRPVGTVGEITATSFYPTKNLGAMGDGGALLTNDTRLAEKARCLRDYGQTAKYCHEEVGMNSRLDEVQAAILAKVGLPLLPGWTDRRKAVAVRYRDEIMSKAVELPPVSKHSESVCHLFPVLVERRGAFMDHLKKEGVIPGIHYPVAIPDQKAFAPGKASHRIHGTLEGCHRFCTQEVSLPIHPYLHEEEVEQVVRACNAWGSG